MSKFLNRDSEGWNCARDDLFNRMVTNLQVNKQKLQQDKFSRTVFEDERLTAGKLQEYENIATRDELTGVYNARYMAHKLVKEVKRCKRYKRPFSLMLISLDHVAGFQQSYGVSALPEFIKTRAHLISTGVRDVDIVGRLATDQFAIILPETDSSRALIVGERIREKIVSLPLLQEGLGVTTSSISIGLASFPTHARDENTLLTTAGQYLEKAQKLGNNHIVTS